jgi:hypothetical protein
MDKDRIASLDFTVVGGPAHGLAVDPKHGYRPLLTMPTPNIPFSCVKPLEHIPHRFTIGKNESVITVFSPANMPIEHTHAFLNGVYSDDLMRSFNPWRGHFVS